MSEAVPPLGGHAAPPDGSWSALGLDSRLLHAISKLGWPAPRPVQFHAISLALEGRDVVARSPTGSGKTAAFLLPMLNLLLRDSSPTAAPSMMVLAPTPELCSQIGNVLGQLATYCRKTASYAVLSTGGGWPLAERPAIVITTPSQILEHVKHQTLSLDGVRFLTIDEADLLASCGYMKDLTQIKDRLPKLAQGFLTSATMDAASASTLSQLLNNPAVLELGYAGGDDDDGASPTLTEYLGLVARGADRYLDMYLLLQFQVLSGKTLIFTRNANEATRLKLVLGDLGIAAAVAYESLPANLRLRKIEEFNRVEQVLIVSDGGEAGDEYDLSRGIDFDRLPNVVNFDMPSTRQYLHRIGRTARSNRPGTVFTFGAEAEGQDFVARLRQDRPFLRTYRFDPETRDGFRYRLDCVLADVTKSRIKKEQARVLQHDLAQSRESGGATLVQLVAPTKERLPLTKRRRPKSVRRPPPLAVIPKYLRPASAPRGISPWLEKDGKVHGNAGDPEPAMRVKIDRDPTTQIGAKPRGGGRRNQDLHPFGGGADQRKRFERERRPGV